jgi:hypothetical protein
MAPHCREAAGNNSRGESSQHRLRTSGTAGAAPTLPRHSHSRCSGVRRTCVDLRGGPPPETARCARASDSVKPVFMRGLLLSPLRGRRESRPRAPLQLTPPLSNASEGARASRVFVDELRSRSALGDEHVAVMLGDATLNPRRHGESSGKQICRHLKSTTGGAGTRVPGEGAERNLLRLRKLRPFYPASAPS